jgi:peroxiredoxin
VRLDNGDRFPDLTADLVRGDTLKLPAGSEPGWTVLLFYRGHW